MVTRLIRTVATVATLATLVTLVGVTDDASAVASGKFAKLECAPGRVKAYAPLSSGVYSSYPASRVYIGSELLAWNGTTWVRRLWSGYWAYGISWTGKGIYGYQLAGSLTLGGMAWISTANEKIIPNQFPFWTFTVSPGTYAVRTWLYDATDGKWTSQINHTRSDSAGTSFCTA